MSSYPIVFLHGHTLDQRMWQPQLEFFKSSYAPNLRGYGRVNPPKGEFSFTDDVLQELEGQPKIHLVGLSLGGNIALEFAIRYPEKIQTLALLDSSLKGFMPDIAQIEAGTAVQNAFEKNGLEVAKQTWLGLPLFAAARENPELIKQLQVWLNDYSGWHWIQGISPSAAIADVSKQLDQVRAKTLIMVGQRDTAYFQNVARYLHQGIMASNLEVIAAAGHMVNLEQPKIVNALLESHFFS